jgi:hypothetical protein
MCLCQHVRLAYVPISARASLFPGPYANMPTDKAERRTVDDLVARNICPVKEEYVRPFQTAKTVDSVGSASQEAGGTKKKSKKRARQVRSHDVYFCTFLLPLDS